MLYEKAGGGINDKEASNEEGESPETTRKKKTPMEGKNQSVVGEGRGQQA